MIDSLVRREPNSTEARQVQALPTLRTWLTMERVVYAVILCAGFGLRVWNLGGAPLSPWEAANSWPAWLAAQGLHVEQASAPLSALAYGLQWLIFWIGVNSDAGARSFALVAGTALILLPWWLRGIVRRETALLLAALLALDPWLIQYSRLADGAILALVLGCIALISGATLVTGVRGGRAAPDLVGKLRALLIACGLLLVSGPMGPNMLLVLALAAWLWREELSAAGLFVRSRWIWLAGAALFGGTFGLIRPEGLAWLGTGMGVWLSQFDGRPSGPLVAHVTGLADAAWPWARLAVDAPMTAVLGTLGLAAMVRHWAVDAPPQTDAVAGREPGTDRRIVWLLLGWAGWGVLLCLLPGRSPLALPMLGLPLTLATTYWIRDLWRARPSEMDVREVGAVAATMLILLGSIAIWSAALFHSRALDITQARLVLMALVLGIAIVVAFGVWARRDVAVWLIAVLIGGLLLTVNLRAAWHLKQESVTVRAGWQALTTHPDIRNLARDVATLSAIRTGDATQLAVQVQIAPMVDAAGQTIPARPDASVGWALRSMRNLTWVTAPQVDTQNMPGPLVVTHAALALDGLREAGEYGLPELEAANYVGSTYRVEAYWLPQHLTGDRSPEGGDALVRWWMETLRPWVRWVVYREVGGTVTTRSVALWAPGIEGR